MNRTAIVVAIATLLAGLVLFGYGAGPLRGWGGDIGIVVFLVASLATVPIGTPRLRVLGVLAFAFAVEGLQGLDLVGTDAHWLWHLTLGSTFDPLDLVAYTMGAGLAALAECGWAQHRGPATAAAPTTAGRSATAD